MGSIIGVGRFRRVDRTIQMKKSVDEMWLEARPWYEKNYKDPQTKKPIYFEVRPSDKDIVFLWEHMNTFKRSVQTYFNSGNSAVTNISKWAE